MRIFVAGFATETNTFSPIFADLNNFRASHYAPAGQHGPPSRRFSQRRS